MENNYNEMSIIQIIRGWMRFSIERVFLYQGCLIVLSDEQYLCSNISLCYFDNKFLKLKDGYFLNSDLNYNLGKFINISDKGFVFTKGEVRITPFEKLDTYIIDLLEGYKEMVFNPSFKFKIDDKVFLGKLWVNTRVNNYVEIEKDNSDLYVNNKFIANLDYLKILPDFVVRSMCKPLKNVFRIFYRIGSCNILVSKNKIGFFSEGQNYIGIIV